MTDEHQGLDVRLDRIEKKLDSVCFTLHGNGRDGLTTRMAVIEGRCERIQEEKLKSADRVWGFVMGRLVPVVLSALLAAWLVPKL